MREIKLTQGKFAQVDDADFDWLNKFKWCAHKHRCNIYYAVRNISLLNGKSKTILMHRQILDIIDVKIKGDHRDHNGLNNQRYNLRKATDSQNSSNISSQKNSTSKYLGVNLFKIRGTGKKKDIFYTYWRAGIKKNKKSFHLGIFKDEVIAALAYNEAALKRHGEFANLNIIS